jgi:hypothetical protein
LRKSDWDGDLPKAVCEIPHTRSFAIRFADLLAMETPLTSSAMFFFNLCSSLQTYDAMPANERKRAAYRNASLQTCAAACEMVPDILKGNAVCQAINSAMISGSIALVKAFPKKAYGTYSIDPMIVILDLLGRNIHPDMLFAVSERGMSMEPVLGHILTRAFRQKDEEMRKWVLAYLAPQPGDFAWVTHLTPHNIRKHPDFTSELLTRAVAQEPGEAGLALTNALSLKNGLQVALLLQAGARLPATIKPQIRAMLDNLSNHAKLQITRATLAEFAVDESAVWAARHLFKK